MSTKPIRISGSSTGSGVQASGAASFEVTDLYKSFDAETMVNDGISLRMEPGEVYRLLGPNGAGMTTLVKKIIGLLKPDSGSITFGGYDLVADPSDARWLGRRLRVRHDREGCELGHLVRTRR